MDNFDEFGHPPIAPEKQLTITNLFGVGKATAWRTVLKVVNALGVIGMVDGTHIPAYVNLIDHTASTYTEKTSVSRIRKIRYKPGSKPVTTPSVHYLHPSTNRGLCGKSLIIDKQVFREKHLRVNRSQSRKCVTSVVLSASIKVKLSSQMA
ncbi:hypothetical protein PV325_003285 [Microctonus aethiopoides]|nr:hypothetical protein PV325_003285 [Microctonus aethiopoides]